MSLSYWAKRQLRRNWRKGAGSNRGTKRNNHREDGPVVEPTGAVPLPGYYKNNHTEHGKARGSTAENWMAIFTGILTVLAVLTLGVNFWQWKLGRDQLNLARGIANETSADTREALKISGRLATAAENQATSTRMALGISGRVAGAAEIQAQSSREQVTASIGQMKAQEAQLEQLRTGIIEIKPEEIDLRPVEGGVLPVFGLTVKNVGTVPVRVKTIGAFNVEPIDQTTFDWRGLERQANSTIVTIAPGDKKTKPFQTPNGVSDIGMKAVMEQRAALRARAILEYTDATGKPKRERFCFEWHGIPTYEGLQAHYCHT